MNDSVETAGEAGGRHPGHPGLHTVYEEAGHNVFHTEHVETRHERRHGRKNENDAEHHECEWRTDRYRDRK